MHSELTDDERIYADGKTIASQPQWTRDFPTDEPEDERIARREFVKFLVLTSGAFASGQCWIALAGRHPPAELPRMRIATLDELQVRRVIEFRYPAEHDPCLLIQMNDGRIVAYGQECPHLACAVIPDLANNDLICPCHKGRFELAGGHPTAGPPRRPLPIVRIAIENGEIHATGLELRTA